MGSWWRIGAFLVVTSIGCSSTQGGPAGSSSGAAGDGGTGGRSAAGSGSAASGAGGSADTGGTTSVGGTGDAAGEAGAPTMPDACLGVVCDSPPAAACDGTAGLTTYDASGTCEDGVCAYVSHLIECDCESGACSGDLCVDVTCDSPPAAACKDAGTLHGYAASGTCQAGACVYAAKDTTCALGCEQGACRTDPCALVSCNQPPASTCKNPSTKTSYAITGTCSAGECSYGATDSPCAFGCAQGECKPDPCTAVSCNEPPAAVCNGSSQLKTYDQAGTCTGGTCTYKANLISCACNNGACNTDPCLSVTCTTPPAAICKDSSTRKAYAATGTCDDGSCGYASTETDCQFGCANGACLPDPCAGVSCQQTPPAVCQDSSTKRTYAASGSCSLGTCSYASTDSDCPFGCANGACNEDPCTAVSCNSAPIAFCKSSSIRTAYAPSGTCSAGDCNYESTDTACPVNNSCGGAGYCSTCTSDDSCGPSCSACGGSTPKCEGRRPGSKCVACVANADCPDSAPRCAANLCVVQASCVGLAKTCGPTGDGDCCAASLVTGGKFKRDNDSRFPATISDFRLDDYEVTVGRFRQFLAVYQPDMTPLHGGQHPQNSGDPGWETAWNQLMPSSSSFLAAALQCAPAHQTWTDAPGSALGESLPINCVSWYEAEAFCIWDGGRLPTEAEWNYAAAGGSAQRDYPWGNAAPDCSYANHYGVNEGTDYCVDPGVGSVNRVGSEASKGDGRFGQSDLAGNVAEWVKDLYDMEYIGLPVPGPACEDCVNYWGPGKARVNRGGSFEAGVHGLRTSTRMYYAPGAHQPGFGFRCARRP